MYNAYEISGSKNVGARDNKNTNFVFLKAWLNFFFTEEVVIYISLNISCSNALILWTFKYIVPISMSNTLYLNNEIFKLCFKENLYDFLNWKICLKEEILV